MLADADDEQRRLAFIQLLVDEGAKDKLAAHRNGRRPINLVQNIPKYSETIRRLVELRLKVRAAK